MRLTGDRKTFNFLSAGLLIAILTSCTIVDTRNARAFYAKGDFERAADEYLVYIQENPNSPLVPDAFIGLAWSRYQLREYFRAAEAADIMRGRFPGHHMVPTAGYIVSISYFSQRKFVEASNELRELILNYPRDPIIPEARFLLARSEAGMLRYASADKNYEAYLAEFGNSAYAPAALLNRAEVLIKLAKFDEAEKMIEAFIERFPRHVDRPGALVKLAELKSSTGRYDEAAGYLEEMLREFPDDSANRRVWEALGELYVGMQNQERAAEIYQQLIDSLPPGRPQEQARLTSILAGYYADMRDTENARVFYSKLIKQKSVDPGIRAGALRRLFQMDIAEGRAGDALRRGEQFLTEYPDDFFADDVLGEIVGLYVSAGRVADGRNRLAQHVRSRSAAATAQEYIRLANLNIELGEYEQAGVEAEEGLARARRAGDSQAVVSGLYTIMIVNGLMENLPDAIERYWELKELDSRYITASEKLYWDAVEEKFFSENRSPIPLRHKRAVDLGMKIHVAVAGFQFASVDSASVGLATSLWRLLAASIGSRKEFQFVPQDQARFLDDLVGRLEYDDIPDTYFPLRSNIGTDWIIHGDILRDMMAPDGRTVVLRLRLLRVDYEGIFPFEYVHRFTQEETRSAASNITRDIVDKLVLYRPDR